MQTILAVHDKHHQKCPTQLLDVNLGYFQSWEVQNTR